MTEISDEELERRVELAKIPGEYSVPPAGTVGKLPRYTGNKNTAKADREKRTCTECGKWHDFPSIHLDYVGHADLTLMFIAVDPFWSWRPMALEEDGTPLITTENQRLVMWGYVTVLGKELLGVGTCEVSKGDPEKELIGDLLRNVGLRFGFATSLWSKADTADPASNDDEGGRSATRGRRAPVATDADAPADPVEQTGSQLIAMRFSKLPADQKQAIQKQCKEQGISNVMRVGVNFVDKVNAMIDAIVGIPGEHGETIEETNAILNADERAEKLEDVHP